MSISGTSPQPAAPTPPEQSCGHFPLTGSCCWPASACCAPDHTTADVPALSCGPPSAWGSRCPWSRTSPPRPSWGGSRSWSPAGHQSPCCSPSNSSPTTRPLHPAARLHRRTRRPVTGRWRPRLPRTRPVVQLWRPRSSGCGRTTNTNAPPDGRRPEPTSIASPAPTTTAAPSSPAPTMYSGGRRRARRRVGVGRSAPRPRRAAAAAWQCSRRGS
jgi:hypothetical protein